MSRSWAHLLGWPATRQARGGDSTSVERRLSVTDIARELGVKYNTVAKYVQGYPLSSEERRQRYLDKMQQMVSNRWPKRRESLMARFRTAGRASCEYPRCSWDVTLELHDVNGNPLDNTPDNLQILCPNHHSITPNWRNRRRSLSEATRVWWNWQTHNS